jgi:phosphoribosylpyrophosphate synthetase
MSCYNNHQHRFKGRDLRGKTVVLLDKCYTGGTLNKMANLVKKEGGRPIKVALFLKVGRE